jgi:NADH-quinone oxidoreductase subunit N
VNENVAALLPEAFLAGAAVAGLLSGSWLRRSRQWLIALLVTAACVAGIAAAAATLAAGRAYLVFSDVFAIDTVTGIGRIIVLAAVPLVICLSIEAVRGDKRETEYYVLLALSATGTLAMVGAADLLMLFAGFLLTSIAAYALAGFAKDRLSMEASLKYYLIGALCGVVMLTGITLLYAAGGGTGYAMLRAQLPGASHVLTALGMIGVLAGLLFKSGAVPAHFWVPDVTDGTPAPIAAFLTTVPKIGALIGMYRFVHQALPGSGVDWPLLLAVLATASMSLGNFAAFFQTSAQRLLAYSTISQVGYLLIPIVVADGRQSLLFYLAGYAVTNLGAFAVVTCLPQDTPIAGYRGLFTRQPAVAVALLVCLLGLVGTPPTAVFIGKLEVFTAAIDGHYAWLAVVAVVNTVASLFYYLRWLVPVFQSATGDAEPRRAVLWPRVTAYSAAAASIVLGVAATAALPAGGPVLP